MEWHAREIARFADGTYTPLPTFKDLQFPAEHYVHRALKSDDLTMIAYTPSEAYGAADRQVQIRFGKYLRKTFPAISDARIQELTIQLRGAVSEENVGSEYTLLFAHDRETISDIFETRMGACDSQSTSCMYGKFNDWEHRPYHVYADSPDVAVAYLTHGGQIVARSVVSTKDKTYVRLYSTSGCEDLCSHLRSKLEALGYSKNELFGNRLTMLPAHGSKQVLPYIDTGGQWVSESHGYWVVSDSGEYECDQVDGLVAESGPRCESCGGLEDDCECSYCDCCEERYGDGCDNCRMCEHCDRCITHDNCQCARCSECNELIEHHRYCTHCHCDRCSECNELLDDCECETDSDSGRPQASLEGGV